MEKIIDEYKKACVGHCSWMNKARKSYNEAGKALDEKERKRLISVGESQQKQANIFWGEMIGLSKAVKEFGKKSDLAKITRLKNEYAF